MRDKDIDINPVDKEEGEVISRHSDFGENNPDYPYEEIWKEYPGARITEFQFLDKDGENFTCEWHHGRLTKEGKHNFILVFDGKEADEKTGIIHQIRTIEEEKGIPGTSHVIIVPPRSDRDEEYMFCGKGYKKSLEFTQYLTDLIQDKLEKELGGDICCDLTTVGFSLTGMFALHAGSVLEGFERRKIGMISPSVWQLQAGSLYISTRDKHKQEWGERMDVALGNKDRFIKEIIASTREKVFVAGDFCNDHIEAIVQNRETPRNILALIECFGRLFKLISGKNPDKEGSLDRAVDLLRWIEGGQSMRFRINPKDKFILSRGEHGWSVWKGAIENKEFEELLLPG